MTTSPSGQAQESEGWITMDARDRTQEFIAQLDSTANIQGVEQGIRTRLNLLELAPGQSVLEVASGTGEFASRVAAARKRSS